MNLDKNSLLLYAVTDRSWLKGQTLAQQVEQALLGGATMVQLREKQLDLPHFRREALEIQALCRRYGAPFLINDNVDLALEIGADGVHVGQEDMEARLVRQKLGPGKILGVSAHSPEEALRAHIDAACARIGDEAFLSGGVERLRQVERRNSETARMLLER